MGARKLLSYLANTRGYTVRETSPGIYLVSGDYIPIQIIESQKLPEKENLWLESLRDSLKEDSLDAILLEEKKKRGQGIRIDAYLDVILRANPRTYMEVCKMKYPTLEELVMGSELGPRIIERGRLEGLERGRVEGMERTVRNLLARSMPIEDIAQVTELPVEKIRSLAAAS